MTEHDETEQTAARLRSALSAAADVMVVPETPVREHVKPARGWLLPIAAAASVVVVVLASLLGVHLTGSTRTQSTSGITPQPARPEFYLTAIYSSSGPNVLHIQVRRTDGGAVTGSTTLPASGVSWGGEIAADASGRAFYIARYPCTGTGSTTPLSTLDRITITGSGQISGIAAAGPPVRGKVTDLAVSPDGSQLAYNALPGGCPNGAGFRSAAAAAVSIEDLSTGAVRTWQDATPSDYLGGLSWAPDGRTLVVDEDSRAGRGPAVTVYRLDAASSGGALQAHSTVLLDQGGSCATCVTAAVAGPGDSLTALEYQLTGHQTRVLVVRLSPVAGSRPTVLYSELTDQGPDTTARATALVADSSGQWVLLWPAGAATDQQNQLLIARAGWISDGTLHPLPGAGQVFPEGAAW